MKLLFVSVAVLTSGKQRELEPRLLLANLSSTQAPQIVKLISKLTKRKLAFHASLLTESASSMLIMMIISYCYGRKGTVWRRSFTGAP